MVETGGSLHAEEMQPAKTRCVYISGLSGNTKGLEGKNGIKDALEAQYGTGNVTTYGSIVSSDKPDRERYAKMADTIMSGAKSGRLDLILHSLGVSEFVYIKRAIKKRDKHFFDEATVKNNLRLVKIAESGNFKGVRERIDYLKENARLGKHLGAEAMYAFPVEGVSGATMSKMFAPPENRAHGYEIVPFTETQTNSEYLLDADKKTKSEYDAAITNVLIHNNLDEAARVAEMRATALQEPLQAVFDTNPKREKRDGKVVLTRKGVFTLARALSNQPTRVLRRLRHGGIQIDTIQAELDRVTKLPRAVRFYGSEAEAKKNVTVMHASPHSGIALQPGEWARVIKATGEKAA